VLSGEPRDVGDVVLNRDRLPQLESEAGRGEPGVEVARDPLRKGKRSEVEEVIERPAQELERIEVFRTADVLGEVSLAVAVEGEGHVEVPPQGEEGLFPEVEGDRLRDPAPRPAKEGRGPAREAHHRVVAAGDDPPVVEEEPVGDPREVSQDLFIRDEHRPAWVVGARHHERER